MTDLCVDAVHLGKWVADRGRWVGVHRSDERTFISVGCLIRVCAAPANIHDVETRLHSAVNWNRLKVRPQRRARVFFVFFSFQINKPYWLLCGKSSRCCMVTKGWLRASAGAILSSASINNIFFSRPTNSLRSAFSASKSLPSRFITKFTCKTFCRHCYMHIFLSLWELIKEETLRQKRNCLRCFSRQAQFQSHCGFFPHHLASSISNE